ncbi:MAG: PH domain-containing protein [bacterium]|nr:PH domain-containing protein [bacterium]
MSSSRRLHRWSLLFMAGDALRGLIFPLAALVFTARQSPWELWIAWFSLPVAGFSVWRYFTTWYELADDELIVRTGLLFRNVRHVRYARVHNIETVQGPLHRLLGVADVRVETAGASEQEARLRVLALADADEVRRRVVEGKRLTGLGAAADAGAVPVDGSGSSATEVPAARELVRLRLRDLLVFGLTQNRGGIVLGAALGALWEANLFDSSLGKPTDMVQAYLSRLLDDGRLFAGPDPALLALLAGGAAAVLVVIRLLSVGWAVVQLHGFTLTRVGDELRTTRGLLTRVHGTIPLGRVQLVTVRQAALMRLFDRVEVRVQTAGGDKDASPGREWLAPSLPSALVDGLMAEIHPGITLSQLEWRAASPQAACIAVPAAALTWYVGGCWARSLGHVLLAEHVGARGGWWCRQTSLARYAKIQVVSWGASPFDRRWKMATVAADTAGGGGHRLAIPLLPVDEAGSVYAGVRDRATASGFRW